MKKLFFLIPLLTLTLCFTNCESNDDAGGPNNNGNFNENFGNSASRDFIGQVVDMNNDPVQNASIKIGTSTAMTDSNGVFIINGASVYERFAYITATKAGFLNGSRAMVPTNGKNNVKIMLIPSTPIATIESGAAATVSLPSGTEVEFDGSFEDEDGVAYNGDVSVSMYHLMTSNDNIASLMPGMMYAEDSNGNEAMLNTFGMMNVELRGSGGQKLQIASGHMAEIKMNIDPTQLSSAPSSIPLWHFDEEAGYWKQEGSATRVGNQYVGSVSHFSWWNCDAYSSVVTLTVSVVDADGNAVSNVGVGLTAGEINSYIMSTSNNGQVSGIIPANLPLTLTLYDNCGNSIYTAPIGPFSTNTVLPAITITASMSSMTTVEGSLTQCDGTPVTDGYVVMNYGNQFLLSAVTAGDFSFTTLVCSADAAFTLEGVNYDGLQTTGEISYTFTSPLTTIGTISACNAVSEFISYSVDGGDTIYITTGISTGANPMGGPNSQGLTISGQSTTGGIYIWGNNAIPGLYTTADGFAIEGSGVGYVSQQNTNTVVFNLTNVGAVGEYIDMTFAGTYEWNGASHTISGVVHVIRDN